MNNHLLLDTKPSTILKAFKDDLIARNEFYRVFAFSYLESFMRQHNVCIRTWLYTNDYLKKGISSVSKVFVLPSNTFAEGLNKAIKLAEANRE